MTAEPVDLERDAWLRDVLEAQAAVLPRAAVPAEAGDADALHDLRVAMRRSRSLLGTFGPLLDHPEDLALVERLRAAGLALSPGRDDDVVRQLLAGLLTDDGQEGLRALLTLPTRTAPLDLPGPGLVHDLAEVAARVPDVDPALARPLLAGEWRRLRRRVATAGKARRRERVEALHRVRKAAKRARYAAEALDGRESTVALLAEQVQDALGEHRDTVLVEARLREVAARHPDLVDPLRELRHRVRDQGRAALARYGRLADDVAGLKPARVAAHDD